MNPTLELHFWLRLLGILALETSFVIAVAFAAQTFIRGAFWRRAIWQITFVCLLCVAGAELTGVGRGFSVWLAGKPVPERKISVRVIPIDEQFLPPVEKMEMPEPVFIPEKETPMAQSVWWPGILWLAGFGLIAARIFCARIFLALLRWTKPKITDAHLLNRAVDLASRLGVRRKIHLLETSGLSSPMTFGILSPSIGLPLGFAQKFAPAQQDAMLAHELAHLVAHDPFWYLLADFAAAFLWWQPLVWWARRRLHSTSEHAADEAAALVENGPDTLAECLVQLGQQMTRVRSFGWLGVDGNGFRSHLGQRIERLLNLKEAHKPRRGWKIFFAKTGATILSVALVILTAGWVQSKNAYRAENLKTALAQSWNNSFSSQALYALAENQKKPTLKEVSPRRNDTPQPRPDEPVAFDAVFYDDVSAEQLEKISRKEWEAKNDHALLTLSSNDFRAALLPLSEISSTYDSVGSKFSGLACFYRGAPEEENQCEYFSDKIDGIVRIKKVEMTYKAGNPWSFSFVPQKLAFSTWINLDWPDQRGILTTGFEIPADGGTIIRHVHPNDPAHTQLILFSSKHIFPRTTNDAEIEWSDRSEAKKLISEGVRLFERGNFGDAKAKLNEALKLDPKNSPALYYQALTKEAELRVSSKKAELIHPTLPPRSVATNGSLVRTNLSYTTKGRETIKTDLERIRLPSVEFQTTPLSNALKFLRDESMRANGKGKGINFMFNPRSNSPDPAPADFNQVTVQIKPALTNVSLAEVLDALVKSASSPIEYVVEDYAVVFRPKAAEPEKLYNRTFKVNPNTFLPNFESLRTLGPVSLNRTENGGFSIPRSPFAETNSPGLGTSSRTNNAADINQRLRDFFTKAGVDFGASPATNGNSKAAFFNERAGVLMVRATLRDLEIIQTAIEVLNVELAQIMIEAKFVELDEAASRKLGFDWLSAKNISPTTSRISPGTFPSSTNSPPVWETPTNELAMTVTGILTELQYRTALRALEKLKGTDILTAPRVTTLSGRQAQISVLDLNTVVTGLSSATNGTGGVTNTFQTQTLPFGPGLDVLPSVSANDYTIQMTIIATVTEFLGYQEPDRRLKKFIEPNSPSTLPLPQFRVRQASTVTHLYDGQTVVLGGMIDKSKKAKTKSAKNLIVFVTATMVDPAGNRIHKEDEIPFTKDSAPGQKVK